MSANSIVKRLPEKQSTQQNLTNPQIKSCKICLLEGVANDESLNVISPCKCSGSLMYVHEKCIKHWLQTKLQQNNGQHLQMKCEICSHNIDYETQNKYFFTSCDETKERIQDYKCLFFVKILMFLSMLGLIAFVITLVMGISEENTAQQKQMVQIVSLVIFVVFPILIVIWSISFIYNFMLKQRRVVKSVNQYDKKK